MPAYDDANIRDFQINSNLKKSSRDCEFIGTALINSIGGGSHVTALFGIPSQSLDNNNNLVDYDTMLGRADIKALREKGTDAPYFAAGLLAIRDRESIIQRMKRGARPGL